MKRVNVLARQRLGQDSDDVKMGGDNDEKG